MFTNCFWKNVKSGNETLMLQIVNRISEVNV